MNGQDSKATNFDVFLSYNSEDKQAVREIAQMLVKEGIKPWLDEYQIRPGTSWQTALGQQIESIKSAAVFMGDGGLGPWQDHEMQSFLDRFVNRKCAVIPVILPSTKATPELPWPLENLHRVDFRTDSYPLKRLIWGITGQRPPDLAALLYSEQPATMREAARPRLIAGRDDQARSDNIISEARLYPPLAERPDPDNTAQLNILRKRVNEYWVDGVLEHSLYNEVLISLDKREIDKAVDAPWKYTVEVADVTDSTPLDDRNVSALYDATGLLLILGEPGSGKTTTLLDLARTLLDRARDNIRERVPIVVNLSSWRKNQPLAEWISNELSEKYRVPRKIARFWLQRGYLLPLLDGLDEIETSMQSDCVASINAFIEEFKPSGLVVCCRLNDYRWLPKRLKLNGAICIEPLTLEEVSKYLAAGGSNLAGLRKAIGADSVLHELAQTPLMLGIMSLACQGADSGEFARQKGDFEERRKQIFAIYVEQMFQRKGSISLGFRKEKIIGWLSWLAGKMREHSQSVFLVEGLQPSWLDTRAQRGIYGTIVALSLGLIFGFSAGLSRGLIEGLIYGLIILVGVQLGCWSKSPLKNGVMSGSIGGLITGLGNGLIYGLIYGLAVGLISGVFSGLIGVGAGSLNNITLVETLSWKWNQFWRKTIPGSIVGSIVGLAVGPMWGLKEITQSNVQRETLIFWMMIYGVLVCGLFGGLVSGLVGGFTDRVKVGKASPNQGIKLSRKNSLAAFLVTLLTFVLICGLSAGLIGGLSALIGGLSAGLIDGLFYGLIVGLNRGGAAVIKHYALRLILWWNGYTPLKLVKFLDHCAKLILLKKVGGGYIFVHRMLLDYFADFTPQSTAIEEGKTAQVPASER